MGTEMPRFGYLLRVVVVAGYAFEEQSRLARLDVGRHRHFYVPYHIVLGGLTMSSPPGRRTLLLPTLRRLCRHTIRGTAPRLRISFIPVN